MLKKEQCCENGQCKKDCCKKNECCVKSQECAQSKEVETRDPRLNIMERIARMRDDMNRSLAHNMSFVTFDGSHVKCVDNDEGREILVSLPGIDKKNVELSVVGRLIAVEYKQHEEEDNRVFVNTGNVDLKIGEEFDLKSIDAVLENGVLKIAVKRIPVKEYKPQSIKIK